MRKIPKKSKTGRLPKINIVVAKKNDKPHILAGTIDFDKVLFKPANDVTEDALEAVRDYLIETMPDSPEKMNGVQWNLKDKTIKLFVCVFDNDKEGNQDENSATSDNN